MRGITLQDTHHGEPHYNAVLPKGVEVYLWYANNMPEDSRIKYWASILNPEAMGSIGYRLQNIENSLGIGLSDDDVRIL